MSKTKDKIDFTLLLKRVKEDIQKHPEKVDQYMAILAKHGLLKEGSILKMKRCSMEVLGELEKSNISVKIV